MKLAHFTLPKTGNAGDIIQSDATRTFFDKTFGGNTWDIIDLREPLDLPRVFELNRTVDAIVIGGGGLFLKDSWPNKSSGWQMNCTIESLLSIKVPIWVSSIGYNRFRGQEDFDPIFGDHLNTLVRKSSFFGVRDSYSIASLRRYLTPDNGDSVLFQPCPTSFAKDLYDTGPSAWQLGMRTIGVSFALDRLQFRVGERDVRVSAFGAVHGAMRRAVSHGWIVKLINQTQFEARHPWVEMLAKEFEAINIFERLNADEIRSTYRGIACMIGMRRHSQTLSLGLGNAIISLVTHDKISSFAKDIGKPEWATEMGQADLEKRIVTTLEVYDRDRIAHQTSLDSARRRLFELATTNARKARSAVR